MSETYHDFYIPVMGTGHSVDSAIRVAPLGISSVISLVDDILLGQVNKYYCEQYNLPYLDIPQHDEDARAKRITAYLNTVWEIVLKKMEEIKKQPFFEKNDKARYFELLPDTSPLRKAYNKLISMEKGLDRFKLEKELTDKMQPGSVDVNIMVKLDCPTFDAYGQRLSDAFSHAKAALRGYANSHLKSSIVFSAGINQSLFNYMTQFRDFYRDAVGEIKKKIILKVSDFRSALIQGKVLAKKGFEIYEFRIESGLNCGGHAFPTNGRLLAPVLHEFREKRDQLVSIFQPLIKKYYEKQGWEYVENKKGKNLLLGVQGGVGTHGEMERLLNDFGVDRVGWASPFLLVPEVTRLDDTTRNLLKKAGKDDLYVSDVSPLNVPFNNLRNSGSELCTRSMIQKGTPGSPCPKGFLVFNTEFTDRPICTASRQYQKKKLEQIDSLDISEDEKEKLRTQIMLKTCICNHLGSGVLITLGLAAEKDSPQAVCPGPNLAWFNELYTLEQIVDHIYGRGKSLVPEHRPHMFAEELVMYVDYFDKNQAGRSGIFSDDQSVKEFKDNLEEGMDFYLKLAQKKAYDGEQLASLVPCVSEQRTRLASLYTGAADNEIRLVG